MPRATGEKCAPVAVPGRSARLGLQAVVAAASASEGREHGKCFQSFYS
jgi:hypothetical protein